MEKGRKLLEWCCPTKQGWDPKGNDHVDAAPGPSPGPHGDGQMVRPHVFAGPLSLLITSLTQTQTMSSTCVSRNMPVLYSPPHGLFPCQLLPPAHPGTLCPVPMSQEPGPQWPISALTSALAVEETQAETWVLRGARSSLQPQRFRGSAGGLLGPCDSVAPSPLAVAVATHAGGCLH